MATVIHMPSLGQTMEEGTIVSWFIAEGESIKAGDRLLEVMTDKVNIDVESLETGVLRKIIAPVDAVIPVGDPICIIGTADEDIAQLLTAQKPEEAMPLTTQAHMVDDGQSQQAEPGRLFSSPAARRVARENGLDISALATRGTGPNGRIIERDVVDYISSTPKVTPLAGKMAVDMGIDIGAVSGTGTGGRITSHDVVRAATVPASSQSATEPGSRIPYTGIRKTVGDTLLKSVQTIPQVTITTTVDMAACVALRAQILEDIGQYGGVRITYTDIIVKATARAIQDHAIVNSSLVGNEIVIHDHVNIGIATSIEGALVVPVIKDVPSKTLPMVSIELKRIAAAVCEGKQTAQMLADGTFTISNLGSYGITSFNPIVTPGQSAILGVCAIVGSTCCDHKDASIRYSANLCLSFDHRVMDGVPAAQFLARLKQILETPYLLLT